MPPPCNRRGAPPGLSALSSLLSAALMLGLMLWLMPPPAAAQGASSAAAAAAPRPAPRIVRYAVLAAFPPFQVWPEGGVPGGADLEIVGELARAAGIVLQPVRYTDLARLEADLEAGRVQLASAMARTREREDRLLYTPPYGQFQLALVTRAEQPSGALLPDLAGRSIAVVSGYASQLQADRLFPLASRVVVKTPREGLDAVSSGRADTLLESLPVLTDIIEREQLRGLAIARRIDAPSGRLHLALPLEETALAARLSSALQLYPAQRVESLVEAWTARAPPSRPALQGGLNLSAEEAARLAAWPAPVIGVVGREPPFAQINEQGAAEGLSVDMLRSVLARLGVQPRAWVFLKDEEVNAALLEGRVDILIGADESAARAALLRFVGPFIEYPSVLIGRPEGGAFDLTQLYGRRLALPPASSARPFVESRHPGVQIVDCAAVEACLQAVRDGAADATLADVISAAVVMARRPRADLQIVGVEAQLRRFHSLALAEKHAAVVPLFKRTLDVAIEQEMPALKAHWFSRPLRAEVLRGAAWRYGPWAAGALLLLAALWWWHSRRLLAEVHRRLLAQQAAERVGVAKARFATFLAHEVRNSLHAVIAGSELARQPAAVPDAGATTRMAEAARSTLRLLNNLIDRDRLDAGRLRLHAEPARLGPLVQAVVDEMAPAAELAGLGLQVQLPGQDPLRQLDPLRLQQVLRNVLANALKYSRQGTVEVEVLETAADDVVLEVRDRGRGVVADEVPGLFEPYAATHRNADSAGLGLPISRELARLMGGELMLAPREGGGAVARLTLRAEALPEPPPAPAATAGRRLSVLVVEDAEVFGLLVAHAFEQRGHAVQVVGTLALARQRLAEGGVDLLLSDLHLPDGSGAELLAWARRELAEPRPRLLAMTADRDTAAAALEGEVVLAVLEKTGDAAGLVDRALREAFSA
jgi:two-component system, NarL family, sensor histidine kinase EvgS